uniref:GRAM domain containing 1A n=1 Tax=Laticauda laticaudata TaxID=8630 RepID=A0A8C5RHR3_LATLA
MFLLGFSPNSGTISPRTTPSSSPSLRKRFLQLPARLAPEPPSETMVEKGTDNPAERGPPTATPQDQIILRPLFMHWQMLSPTYKQRNEDFRRIFKGLPEAERLLVDYSCALQRDILLQGRLYLSENWICFYSNIFRWETTISIQLKEVICIKKEKTAKLIPNAIQICTENDKHFFTSFGARDRCFMLIFRLWQNALLDKTLPPRELWHIVHQCYGSELGLTSEDDDYVSPIDDLNGLGSQKEIGDDIDLTELTSRCSTDLKLDTSPLLYCYWFFFFEKYCPDTSNILITTRFSYFVPNFSSSPFLDVTLSSWSGDSKCHQSRVMTYTIPISNPLGPKAAPVVETQTLFRASSKNGGCVVDTEVVTHGIPYEDYFYTVHRYCITKVAKSKARLRVSSEIRYRKQPWSLVKTLIEKNAWSGVEEFFQHLELALVQAEKVLLEESCHGKEPRGLLSGLRRRKRTLSWRAPHVEAPMPTLPDSEGASRAVRPSGSLTSHLSEQLLEPGQGQTVSTVILVISLVLLVLVILNMMLFYRLWSLEHTARTVESWQTYVLSNGKLPQTASEWAEILELQKQFHSVEVQKWKQILKASVELLDEVSLRKCEKGCSNPWFPEAPF